MKDIQNIILKKVGTDRLLHFAFGGWLACLAPNWYYALLVGLLVGLFKELFDKYIKKSVFDFGDWLATFLGSGASAIIIFIMKVIGG